MSKIRFYKVHLKDGNKSWDEIVPAHSQGNAEAYFNNPHINTKAEYMGFHKVDISYNGVEIIFRALNDYYEPGREGYNYLYSHLRVSVDTYIEELKVQGHYYH
jgi:hypothetical protein